jgi:predicted peptidase
MRITLSLAIMVAAISSGCATSGLNRDVAAEGASTGTGFITKVINVNNRDRAYCLYIPREYDPQKAWPLIVALHGSGERGEDGLLQTEVGIGRAIRRHADRFPCLVLMPQCAVKTHWRTAWAKSKDEIAAEISQTCKEFNVDPDRTYLTGLSMGGVGTWTYGAENVDAFAALMPICGGGDPKHAQKLARIPIWAFHGAEDSTVPPQESRQMVEAIKAAGGNVKYTEYEKVNHNSWDQTYDDPDTIKWLLSQKRNR